VYWAVPTSLGEVAWLMASPSLSSGGLTEIGCEYSGDLNVGAVPSTVIVDRPPGVVVAMVTVVFAATAPAAGANVGVAA